MQIKIFLDLLTPCKLNEVMYMFIIDSSPASSVSRKSPPDTSKETDYLKMARKGGGHKGADHNHASFLFLQSPLATQSERLHALYK